MYVGGQRRHIKWVRPSLGGGREAGAQAGQRKEALRGNHALPLPACCRDAGRPGQFHRIHHSRTVYVFPDDFPQRLEQFKRESGLPWAESHRRLGTSAHNLRRWKDKGVRPSCGARWPCWSWRKNWVSATCLPTGRSRTRRGVSRPPRASRPWAGVQGGRAPGGGAAATAGAETQEAA